MKHFLSAAPVLALVILASGAAYAAAGDFKAELTGAEEVPPVETETTGEAKFELNEEMTEMEFELEIDKGVGILGAAGAHIHCAPAGVNGPVAAFLAGAVAGGFNGDLEIKATLTDANVLATACGASLAELIDSMEAGDTYVNVHSIDFPGGEVRGQIGAD